MGICAAAGGAAFLFDSAGVLRVQSHAVSRMARTLGYEVAPGPSASIRFTRSGPYDHRLGYAALPGYIDRLAAADYAIDAQARVSPALARTMDWGLFAAYREKTQAGLAIFDCRGEPIFQARYPERVYARFDDIPRMLVESLLFIENRDLLDEQYPRRNPAIDVERFFKAMFDQSVHAIYSGHEVSGGSTLATQIEKYRHSPSGRTADAKEKLRQMASASLRAYLDGEDTQAVRRRLVLDYLNTVPLAAKEGYGEVSGLGDGLWVWFGRDWDDVNRLLRPDSEAPTAERALAFKQALALMMAERRPSFYLRHVDRLEARADAYLKLLAENGVIAGELRDASLAQPLVLRQEKPAAKAESFTARKASNTVRVNLAAMLGTPRLYDLDRLDLAAHSTLDARLQEQVAAVLARLGDARAAAAEGLTGPHMLQPGDAAGEVLYSFILYERTPEANLLRVQADNLNQPWDVNAGAKLDLGSTAKLRTLLTYLNIVAELHDRYAGLTAQELKATPAPRDKIGQWALAYLARSENRSLGAMLDAALDRTYPAHPGEAFFTGGGLHRFENFDDKDDVRTLTVREGLRRSVNLVFVRLMRDVVRYYTANMDGVSPTLLTDAADPQRLAYLRMHADQEGLAYLRRFYDKYRGKTAPQALALLAREMHAPPARLAAALRYIDAEGDEARFAETFAGLANARLPADKIAGLYRSYAPERFDLNDRGYLARIHPLELWLLRFLRDHPDASFAEVAANSRAERQEVSKWLFKPRFKRAQDVRIATMLEKKAFAAVHRDWQRLGYPFDELVPSYASALGASADRPAALAELMGILLNDGMRRPTRRVEHLNFAVDTPYETRLAHRPTAGTRVLRAEVAQTARRLLADVVKDGTAQRLHRVFKDGTGAPIAVGGKTGTGDQRLDIYGKGGRLVASRAVARTGTFIFYLGDRHFGTLTAYVRGPAAAKFRFTSSLPLQVMKVLAPVLSPALMATGDDGRCRSPVARYEPKGNVEAGEAPPTIVSPGS